METVPSVAAPEPPTRGQSLPNAASLSPLPPLPGAQAPLEIVPPGPAVRGISNRMGLDELEGLALTHNPALARAGATVRSAQGNWVQVGLYPNPFVGYTGQQIGDRGTAGQQGVYFGQMLMLGGKLRLNRAIASQGVREQQQQAAMVRWKVVTDVRLRYVDAVVAQRSIDLTQKLVAVGEQGVQAAEALLKAQEVGRVDALQARIELDQGRLLLARAENRYRASWAGLAAAVGIPQLAQTELVDTLNEPPPVRDWDVSLGALFSASPELGAAQARVSQAAFTFQRARVQPIPNPDNQFMVQRDNAAHENIGMVQSTIVVPLFDRNQGAIRRAAADLAAARADYQRLQLALQSRLALAFERYANGRQQVERYSRDILPHATETLGLVAAGYRQGEFPFLNYLTAQRTYFQVNLAYVEALRELWQSTAVIDGLLLSDSLDAAP